ncbi:D-alanine:D-alanine ligase [Hydrogenivirga sp. 128-5-R1-1]|nr:D-alanine:D-alanine ligase [Hydrogenivirga sp. 128-5-R1-1]
MKIVVLMGGKSSEREISLKTGRAVSRALKDMGHEVHELDLTPEIACELLRIKPDKVFIALHGPYGEDGRIQGLLDILGIPYTGAGVLGSAVAMDKEITKRLLSSEGIPTPPWRCVRRGEEPVWRDFPAVVKPADQGSSVGLSVVHSEAELGKAVKELFELTDKVLVESFIEGRDMTVAILKGKALPVIEIKPIKGIYDYESKYTRGKTEYTFLEEGELSERLQDTALRVNELLGLKDMARVDFRVDGEGNPYVLEVNTVPGMTELSLFPMACEKAGMSFKEMLSIILS